MNLLSKCDRVPARYVWLLFSDCRFSSSVRQVLLKMAAAAIVTGHSAGDIVKLTAAAVVAHNAFNDGLATSIATLGNSSAAMDSLALGHALQHRMEDEASSVLSSVPSSDLSSVASEDDSEVQPPLKRRRRNARTPPTSMDEPTAKRGTIKKTVKAGPTEEDVVDRKTYFEAGLYSGATNSHNNARRVKSQRAFTSGTQRLSRSIEDIVHDFKLDLPLFYGQTLLEQQRDFRLPWDIINDFDLSYLPETPEGLKYRSDALDRVGRQMKPTFYKHISQSKSLKRPEAV